MAEGWAKNDWISSDAVTHTRLNNIGNSQRTIGYGETPGSVTVNGNQSNITALGNVTFTAGRGIVQDAWANVTLAAGFAHGSGASTALRWRKNKDGTATVYGTYSGAHTSGGTVGTVGAGASVSGSTRWIPATIDGGAHVFLVLSGADIVFYGTPGTYTVRVLATYPLD